VKKQIPALVLTLLGVSLSAEADQLRPSIFNGLTLAQENNSLRVSAAVAKRMEELYVSDCTRWCDTQKKIGVWGDGFGDTATQNNIRSQTGYRANTGGALAGVDYGCLSNFFVGAAAAYTHSDLDWKRSRGDGRINSYYGSLYAAWISDFFYASSSAMGAFNQYHATRKLHFSDSEPRAKNHHHGAEFDGRIEAGLLMPYKGLDVRPFDALEYIYVHENGYSERGAEDFDLKIKSKNSMLLRNELGLGVAFCKILDNWNIVPDFKLSWIREWRFKGKHITGEFIDSGTSFTTIGLKSYRSLLGAGVGVTGLFVADQLQVALRYNGEFGAYYRDQNINLQISYAF
jgi:outer membrane autotransporter protein